ncbi:hypothetical protein K1720_06730 [Thermococcus argininiproducens]|uniref:DUF3303 domain-containing protein n=1 Tax=Thermococcus argininiproducens TaxID=2866384 RepID=A0A9E7M959_9EURY|nr:hypothetical protein [Thermococcus argininiproducens]USG99237.1 hypothetical protein K1720_06730 [Thermococcus argininiproducens]
MPMYIITHKWNPEEGIAATKEAARFFESFLVEGVDLPKGVEFLASYNFAYGSYTIWNAPNKEILESIMEDFPVFKKRAETVEVTQSYPPTTEYVVRIWKMVISLADK